MQLYDVQATECNGRPEYSHSKLLAAENIDQAWQMARDYFRQWYDDGHDPKMHDTDNPNEFTFNDGSITTVPNNGYIEIREFVCVFRALRPPKKHP